MVKVKLSLYFFYNGAPYHEGILGEWKYSSTHHESERMWRKLVVAYIKVESWSPGKVSNLGPPKYKAHLLTTTIRHYRWTWRQDVIRTWETCIGWLLPVCLLPELQR